MDILDNGVTLDEREIPDRDIFAQAVDQPGNSILDAAARCHGGSQECIPVGGLRVPDHIGEVPDEVLKIFIIGDRLRFAADADQGAELAVFGHVASDQALLGFSPGEFHLRLGSRFTEFVNGTGDVPIRFFKSPLAFHHREAGLFAKFFYALCVNSHFDSSSGAPPSWRA